MKVQLTPAAEADVREIYRWYEAHGEGLAAEFRRALDACLGRIGRNPRAFPEVHGRAPLGPRVSRALAIKKGLGIGHDAAL